eukprot:366348-Chlamydomonas_euryale.AAC.10
MLWNAAAAQSASSSLVEACMSPLSQYAWRLLTPAGRSSAEERRRSPASVQPAGSAVAQAGRHRGRRHSGAGALKLIPRQSRGHPLCGTV